MAFTHYMQPTRTTTQEQWEAYTKKAKEIIDAFGQPLYNWDGTKEGVEITDGLIRFNGGAAKGEDHETCKIERNGVWNFCKTARKPYDAVVVALLMVGEKMGIIAEWLADDSMEGADFGEALLLLEKVEDEKTDREVMYDHAFSIAFSLRNTDPEGNATPKELIAALFKRLTSLVENDLGELVEACGAPFDTYEVD